MQDKKIFTEQRQGVLESPARSQQLAAVKAASDPESGHRRSVHRVANLLAKVPYAQHDTLHSLLSQHLELMKNERTSGHVEQ
jgi:hypothetical protein